MRLIFHWFFPLILVGCAATQAQRPDPKPTLAQDRHPIQRVALIDIEDATMRADKGLRQAIQEQLDQGLKDLITVIGPVPRVQAPGAEWYRQQGQQLGVQGFITGKITGYRMQGTKRRVWVSLTLKLHSLEGKILWSKSSIGLTNALADQPLEPLYFIAAQRATKEFTDDLITQQPDGSGIAHR